MTSIDVNSPAGFIEMSEHNQQKVIRWIFENLIPRKTFNTYHTSYVLKHLFEKSTFGFYMTNGMFKGAMLLCGFEPENDRALNWCFKISERSPAFRRCSR